MKVTWFVVAIAALLTPLAPALARDQVKILSLQPQSDEEAFLIRRIAEFWKDGDYQIVQSQIMTFLEKYPDSQLKDHLKGILGDLYLQKNNYEHALSIYSEIGNKEVHDKILINKLQCYYELGKFEAITNEGAPYLKHSISSIDERSDEFRFLMAESYFRRSLTTSDIEQKKALSTTAKPLYESLENTAYLDIASFALAEIQNTLGDYPEAAKTYLELAQKYTDQKEELLFHAANLQAQFKPEQAIGTFSEIIAMNGNRAGEATFNRLLIYYQLGHYNEVINAYETVDALIPDDKQALFSLIVGKSYFSVEDYANAITHLKHYSAAEKNANPSLKNALLMLMTASYHQGDPALFNATFDRFCSQFSDDQEMPKAIFTHAMLAKARGDRMTVQNDLSMLLENYPDYEDQEGLLFEYASLTYDHQDWGKSYQSFSNFLTHFGDSDRAKIAWRYFFSSSLNLYKEAQTNDEIHYSKGAFYDDLSQVLDQESVLGVDEMREYRLLQAKTAYELDLFDVAYRKLEHYLEDYPNDPSRAEAHFVAGLASKEINHDLQPVCKHLESAIELGSDFYDTANVHLELYNAYLTLSTLSKDNDAFLCKAALHLYDAIVKDTQPIKVENRLWLANHFYQEAKNTTSEEGRQLAEQRSFYLFKGALVDENTWEVNEIDQDTIFLEAEVLKLSELLAKRSEYQPKITLLKSLAARQNAHPDWEWKFQRHALLELAKTYEHTGNLSSALNTYSFITETAKYSPSPLSYQALLQEARLRFTAMAEKQKTEDNPEMILVLNNLKELQIKKHVATEPLHLEAAYDYARIRSELIAKDKRQERRLFFLKRFKEDFSPSDDPISQEYYTELQQNPEQNHIFQLYMRLVDAEILQLESQFSVTHNDVEKAQEQVFKANRLLEELFSDRMTTPFLKTQAEELKNSLDAMGI